MNEIRRVFFHFKKHKRLLASTHQYFVPNLLLNKSLDNIQRAEQCGQRFCCYVKYRSFYSNCYILSQHAKSQQTAGNVKNKEAVIVSTETGLEVSEETDSDEDFASALLEFYVNKAKNEMDYMDDVDYHDIQDINKRLFYKMVDIWLREVGSTKRGHRDFIQTLLNSLKRFNVQSDISAYLKLLDCFPEGKHTGIRRSHWFWGAFGDKLSDHFLGQQIMMVINENGAIPNDKLFNKTTHLFGRFSPVTVKARGLLFWYPRIIAYNPHPISLENLKQLTPVEIAFNGLRQINPGIDCQYKNFVVDKMRCDEILNSHEIDSIISVQSDKQKQLLAQHDTAVPIFIEGPFLVYYKLKKVQYYIMRSRLSHTKVAERQKQRTTTTSDKEWWTEFYKTDYETGKRFDDASLQLYPVEEFFPSIDIEEGGYKDTHDGIHEISLVDKDTDSVEGPVYAIACTDYKSTVALQGWVRGLLPDNPILKDSTVVFHEEEAFMLNAPTQDPNESLYENIDIRKE